MGGGTHQFDHVCLAVQQAATVCIRGADGQGGAVTGEAHRGAVPGFDLALELPRFNPVSRAEFEEPNPPVVAAGILLDRRPVHEVPVPVWAADRHSLAVR